MKCGQTVDAGAYVLGALAPAERAAYERHLATCPECRYEVSDLAGLPGLLGRLDAGTAISVGRPVTAPPRLLESVLAAAGRERARSARRRHWQMAGAALAAACLALILGVGVPSLFRHPAPSATPVVASMIPMESDTPVSAMLGYSWTGDHTDIRMLCHYSSTHTYIDPWMLELRVYPRGNGSVQTVSSWPAKPGENVSASGKTSLAPSQIARIVLTRADGTPLLFYQVA
jgi:anti-sigma-K factor RskA